MTEAERTIFETPHWRILLHTNDQTYLGRAIVVCTRPVGSIPELTKEEWDDLHVVMTTYEHACRTVLGATLFNWGCLMNLAYQNDPPDPQVHWHVRPRYAESVTFAGETFQDQDFGHHYARGTERLVSDDVAQQMVSALRKTYAK